MTGSQAKTTHSQGTMTLENIPPSIAWLQDISRKLETLTKGQVANNLQIDQLIRGQKESSAIFKELLETVKTQNVLTQQNPEIVINQEHSTLTELNAKVSTFIDFIREDKEKKLLAERAYKFRKSHKGDWSRIVNHRKLTYFDMISYKHLADIYDEFLCKEVPFIPMKFRDKDIPGESQEQKDRKKQLSIEKMKLEIDRLKEQAAKKASILDKCESDIKFVIQQSPDPTVRQKLIEIWMEEIEREQNISKQRWANKESWYRSLPEKENESNGPGDRRQQRTHRSHRRHSYNHNRNHHNISPRFRRPQNHHSVPPRFRRSQSNQQQNRRNYQQTHQRNHHTQYDNRSGSNTRERSPQRQNGNNQGTRDNQEQSTERSTNQEHTHNSHSRNTVHENQRTTTREPTTNTGSLTDPRLHHPFPAYPMMPNGIIPYFVPQPQTSNQHFLGQQIGPYLQR